MTKNLKPAWFSPKHCFGSCLVSLIIIGGGWIGLELFDTPRAMAQISQIPLSLSREPNETYSNFVQRATTLVTTRLKNNFSKNPSLNQLRIVVIGENNGNVAPLLSLNMSRQQWLSNPNPESLINYFPDSQFLLGFDVPKPPIPTTQTSPPTNQPAETPPPSSPNAPASTVPPTNNPLLIEDSLPPASVPPTESSNPPTNSLYNRFRGSTPPEPK